MLFRSRLRLRLSADYERLEFLRVLRSYALEKITDAGGLVAVPQPLANRNGVLENGPGVGRE